jgi:hypothetical protein
VDEPSVSSDSRAATSAATDGCVRGDGRSCSRRDRQRASSPRASALIERPGREDQRERLPLEPARDERERACRRRVAPLQVVDHQRKRRIDREVRCEPVQAVLPRVAGIPGGWTSPGALEAVMGAPVSTSAASAAAPGSQRSRSPLSAARNGRSNSWRIAPNGNPLLRLRRPSAHDPNAELRRSCTCTCFGGADRS